MILTAFLIVVAVALVAVGAFALFNARRGTQAVSTTPLVSQSLADANQYAGALIAEARTDALHSHEAAMEEVNERLAAVDLALQLGGGTVLDHQRVPGRMFKLGANSLHYSLNAV